ncbi:MAG: DUF1232 domain-containing protein [Tannerella sp.]|jgi:uncharacterized membrane protein YkvA (DUF1232 family)|nr:DUF1232 domain-containing protein [Tannerella sp.]
MEVISEENLPVQSVEEAEQYEEYYDEDLFWKKIRRIARKVGKTVLRPVLLLYYTMQDGRVSLRDKAYIFGALGYFILPVDLIPDFIAVLGYTDDLAVIYLLLKHVAKNVTPEIEAQADATLRELLHS